MSAAGTLLETVLTLVFVTGVAIALLYFVRRANVARAFGGAELVGQLPLEPRRAIYLVRLGESVLVVGASEAGLVKLGEVDAASLPEARPTPRTFSDVLSRALRGGANAPRPKDDPGAAS